MVVPKRVNRHLTAEERGFIVAMLVKCRRPDGNISHGEMSRIGEQFGCTCQTVWRLWKRADSARARGIIKPEEFASRKKLCGRKPMYCKETVKAEVMATPLL